MITNVEPIFIAANFGITTPFQSLNGETLIYSDDSNQRFFAILAYSASSINAANSTIATTTAFIGDGNSWTETPELVPTINVTLYNSAQGLLVGNPSGIYVITVEIPFYYYFQSSFNQRKVRLSCSLASSTSEILSETIDVTQVGCLTEYHGLTFEAVENNCEVRFVTSNSNFNRTIIASKNGSTTSNYISSTGGTLIATLDAGDKLFISGDNSTYCNFTGDSSSPHCMFTTSKQCYIYGNVMSLINHTTYDGIYNLTEDGTFMGLFSGCTNILNHSTKDIVLPSNNVTKGCYRNMFRGCSLLTRGPQLPSTDLSGADSCYQCMFAYCYALTEIPSLQATLISANCYNAMFFDCRSIARLSQSTLPAVNLSGASYCYYSMFHGCSSLTTAPALPATVLADHCYEHMFDYCTNLVNVPSILPALALEDSCYRSMFYMCSSLNTKIELPASTLPDGTYNCPLEHSDSCDFTTISGCYSWMFEGCTSLQHGPTLIAQTLSVACYCGMFYGCTSLQDVTCMALDISVSGSTAYSQLHGGIIEFMYGANNSAVLKVPQTAIAQWQSTDSSYQCYKNLQPLS